MENSVRLLFPDKPDLVSFRICYKIIRLHAAGIKAFFSIGFDILANKKSPPQPAGTFISLQS